MILSRHFTLVNVAELNKQERIMEKLEIKHLNSHFSTLINGPYPDK